MRAQGVRSLVASVSSVLAIGLIVSLGAQTNDRAAVPIAPVVQAPAPFSGSTAAPILPDMGVDPLGVAGAQLVDAPGQEARGPEVPEEAPGEDTTVLSVPSVVPTETVAPVTAVAAKPGSGTLLSMPLQGRKTSRFGTRFHPIKHVWKLHSGLDLAAPCGTPVGAAAAGTVVKAGWAGGNGVQVKLDHGTIAGRKVMTTYNHLSAIGVKVGQQVAVHQGVGRVGNTGYSTGCHLHFEVIANGQFTDPEPWLNGTSVAVDTRVMNGGLPAGPGSTTAAPLTSAASPSPAPTTAPSASPSLSPTPTLSTSPSASASTSSPTVTTTAPTTGPSSTPATSSTPIVCPSVTPDTTGTSAGAPCTSPMPSTSGTPAATPSDSTSPSVTVTPTVTPDPSAAPTITEGTPTVPSTPVAPTTGASTPVAPTTGASTPKAPSSTGGGATASRTAAQSPSSAATTTAAAAESTPEA